MMLQPNARSKEAKEASKRRPNTTLKMHHSSTSPSSTLRNHHCLSPPRYNVRSCTTAPTSEHPPRFHAVYKPHTRSPPAVHQGHPSTRSLEKYNHFPSPSHSSPSPSLSSSAVANPVRFRTRPVLLGLRSEEWLSAKPLWTWL